MSEQPSVKVVNNSNQTKGVEVTPNMAADSFINLLTTDGYYSSHPVAKGFGNIYDAESDSDFEAYTSKDRSRHHTVSNEKRLKLIKLVTEQGKKIKPAARKLGINYSTAKSICQIYRREGRTTKKDTVKAVPKKESSQSESNSPTTASEGTKVEGSSEIQIHSKRKSNLEKPCHQKLESMTLRKKVKISQRVDEPPSQKKFEMKLEDLKLVNGLTQGQIKIEENATQQIEMKELGKIVTDPMMPVVAPEIQKAILQPFLRNLQATIPTPNPLIQFQLPQSQKVLPSIGLIQNLPNLAHVISQQASRQITPQIVQLPIQAQIRLQNNLKRVQELQMLNRMLTTGAMGRVTIPSPLHKLIIPKNSFFS